MKKQNNLHKKIGRYILLPIFAMGLFFTSCEDEIINLEPYNQISENVAFSTPSTIELTVLGMYQAAQLGAFETAPGTFGLRGYPFGGAFVQQGDNRGEDVVNLYAFYAFTYEGTYTPFTANNVMYWVDTYRLLNRINIVVQGVEQAAADGVITQAKADEYKGEALLLRAAAYHELLVMFARPYKHTADASHPGILYHKTPFTTPEAVEAGYAVGRHTVAQCYQWILEDLNFAEQHLPLRTARSGRQAVSRGTKGAATAYKVRINQHMWNMPAVITEGLKFMEGGPLAGQHSLSAEPWDVFYSNYANNEYIYGMESSATNYPSVNGALASQYNRRLLVSHSPINWRNEFWLEDDKRRSEEHMVIDLDGIKFTSKYKKVNEYDDLSPMMRYAEVILNIAEAYAREGNAVEGLKYLNMVRNRALADPDTQAYTAETFATTNDLLEAILEERRIELAMEGRRYPDIHRRQHDPVFPIEGVPAKVASGVTAADFELGTPYDGPKTVQAIPYADHRFVWPIPQNELNANPGLAPQQNPGW